MPLKHVQVWDHNLIFLMFHFRLNHIKQCPDHEAAIDVDQETGGLGQGTEKVGPRTINAETEVEAVINITKETAMKHHATIDVKETKTETETDPLSVTNLPDTETSQSNGRGRRMLHLSADVTNRRAVQKRIDEVQAPKKTVINHQPFNRPESKAMYSSSQ